MQDIMTRLQKEAAAAADAELEETVGDEVLSPTELANKRREIANAREMKLQADLAAMKKKSMDVVRKKNASKNLEKKKRKKAEKEKKKKKGSDKGSDKGSGSEDEEDKKRKKREEKEREEREEREKEEEKQRKKADEGQSILDDHEANELLASANEESGSQRSGSSKKNKKNKKDKKKSKDGSGDES